MKSREYTPWFSIKEDGPPVRPGVYEGAAAGRPDNGGGTLQHGYYYWNGERWSNYGGTPEGAADRPSQPVFQASNWRGILPSADYPFALVKEYVPSHFAGTLLREGTVDRVTVARFVPGATELLVKFVRQRGAREPEDYDCTLCSQGSEFVGTTRARIRGFESDLRVEVRLTQAQQGQDAVRVTMSLREAGVVGAFTGVLERPRQVA